MWVLTYHSISDGPAPLCIEPERLAAQLDTLLEAGWHPATLADALAPTAAARSFALTFDDGYLGNAIEGGARILAGPHACPYTICPCSVPANRGMIEGVPAKGARP